MWKKKHKIEKGEHENYIIQPCWPMFMEETLKDYIFIV